MTYLYCKKIIENKSYISKEDMQNKLDIFFLNNRITDPQYNELSELLATA